MKIKKIRKVGIRKVVNLEAIENHTFVTENGIPTHNCDRISPNAQDAYKTFIEEFSKSAYFIFITNHINKIITPLKSRLQTIEYSFNETESKELKGKFAKTLVNIFKKEEVEFEKEVVKFLILSYFPDMRKTLNEAQHLHQRNALTDIEMVKSTLIDVDEYFDILRSKTLDFNKLRKFVTQFNDAQVLYTNVYKSLLQYVESEYIPVAIILLGKYSFEATQGTDPEINMMAFSMDILKEVKFK